MIRTNVMSHTETVVEIQKSVFKLTFGSEFGDAKIDEAGSLVFRSNSTDLLRIADDLERSLANSNGGHGEMNHVHFEPVYLVPGNGVIDIVIELVS